MKNWAIFMKNETKEAIREGDDQLFVLWHDLNDSGSMNYWVAHLAEG